MYSIVQLYQIFATPKMVDCQIPLPMEFFRQEYWSRLPYPTPEHLPDPGIEPATHVSPALAGRFITTSTTCEAPIEQKRQTNGCQTLESNIHNRNSYSCVGFEDEKSIRKLLVK